MCVESTVWEKIVTFKCAHTERCGCRNIPNHQDIIYLSPISSIRKHRRTFANSHRSLAGSVCVCAQVHVFVFQPKVGPMLLLLWFRLRIAALSQRRLQDSSDAGRRLGVVLSPFASPCGACVSLRYRRRRR